MRLEEFLKKRSKKIGIEDFFFFLIKLILYTFVRIYKIDK